ncbi:MAG TPA: hypothetical protein VF033_03085 [Steroidobacteraceae bacterium]
MNKLNNLLALAGVLVFVGQADAAPPACAAGTACVETRSFVATVTGFRTSKQGDQRLLTVTVQFQNRGAKPLTLGYVSESGVALDDRGNRYLVSGPNSVRAIGEVSPSGALDPKFTLQPGEGGDARFELNWKPGKEKAGASFELDLAIREITAGAAEQYKLGAEHALHFASLGAIAAPAATAASASTPAAAITPAVSTDPCAGSPRCFNAGGFVAEVMQVQSSAMGAGVRHQSVSINIRFRNISDKPVILAYRASSSAALDNFGNGFTWGRPGTHDTSVKGIGMVTGRSADTQFQLAPGQSRNATFGIIRFNAAPPIGDRWNYDVVIEEVEIQPGQVVKSVRQNSLTFANLSAGNFPSLAAGGTGASSTSADTVASKLIDLIDRKSRKK